MALVATEQVVVIDQDAFASTLVYRWLGDEKQEVLDALDTDHPGLTALFMYHAAYQFNNKDTHEFVAMMSARRDKLAKDTLATLGK